MPALPSPLPEDPLPFALRWLDDADRSGVRNPWAMALATCGTDARPTNRFVLLKDLSLEHGFIVFYTNYGSQKARQLEHGAGAAAAMYWADSGRQLRFEGPVCRSPAAESDAYFATRPRGSQLNAWASRQSEPLAELAEMDRRLEAVAARHPADAPVARPAFWGGYRLWLAAIEFWCEGRDRYHERVRYERALAPSTAETFSAGAWRRHYLQP